MSDRVSCLCVTRGPGLANALRQFQLQTYANRELVVVHQGLREKVIADLKARARRDGNIVIVHAPKKQRLGNLRNMSVEAATGAWCIQWDDDDAFAPERIAEQLAATHAPNGGRHSVVILPRWYMQDVGKGEVYLSFRRLWEGSMLASRELLQRFPYDWTLSRAEDSGLMRDLVNHARCVDHNIITLLDAPHLYLYRSHGANTWPDEHFRGLFERSQLLTPMQAANVMERFQCPAN